MSSLNPLSLKTLFGTLAVVAQLSSGVALAHEPRTIPMYTTVSEDTDKVVFQGEGRFVENVDVNWRGAHGLRSVNATVLADGQPIWTGIIPPYDPTFRASPNRVIRTLELRVQGGSAYVNWVKVYGSESGAKACRAHCNLKLIGSMTEANELARSVVETINELQDRVSGAEQSTHLLPIKIAAAKVFAVATGTDGMARADVHSAVVALEIEFRNQEGFLTRLMSANANFEPVMALMTLRERYRALFGSVQYPSR